MSRKTHARPTSSTAAEQRPAVIGGSGAAAISWAELRIAAVVVSVTLVLYWPVRHHEFVSYDDDLYVVDNPHVQTGLSWPGVAWAFRSGHAANWHPLTWLSHMLDCQLFGAKEQAAGKHHLTSVVLHAANAALLFILLARMTGELLPSALTAALFAWHPLRVESVAWVAERKDVLSTFLGLTTIAAYVRYTSRPSWARYAIVALFFALALMAKPMWVTLPAVLILLDYWPLGRLSQPRATDQRWAARLAALVVEKLPLLALSALSSMVTFVVQLRGGAVGPTDVLPIEQRIANAIVSYVAYIGDTVWPVGLAVFYPHPQERLHAWQWFLAALVLSVTTVAAVILARRAPYFLVGWLWYLGMLVPVIGIVQVGMQARADRYTYVPTIGLFLIAAWGAARWAGERPWRRAAVVTVAASSLALCLWTTQRQIRVWKNSETLFEHAIQVTTDNHLALNNLGWVLLHSGRIDDASPLFARALQISPSMAAAHGGLGSAYSLRGDAAEAVREFRKTLQLKPDEYGVANNLAWILATHTDARIRNGKEAVRWATRATENPAGTPFEVLDTLAASLAEAGRFEEAVDAAHRALDAAPVAAQREIAERLRLYERRNPYREENTP